MIGNITLNLPAVIEFGAGKIGTLPNHLQGFTRVFILVDKPVFPKIEPIAGEIEKSGSRSLFVDGGGS